MSRPASAPLRVALDLRHPFAYLALGPTLRLGRELGLAIDWLPLCAQTLRPPSPPGPRDDRGIRHRRHRAHMIAREIAVYADAQGLTLREPYRDDPADAANLAWLWVRAEAPPRLLPFLQETFRRYWAVELAAGDPDAVAEVLRACGLDADAFRRWAGGPGSELAAQVAGELAAVGVFQSPAYVLDGEVFYGRQHLPMIRWLLQGRQGPAPI